MAATSVPMENGRAWLLQELTAHGMAAISGRLRDERASTPLARCLRRDCLLHFADRTMWQVSARMHQRATGAVTERSLSTSSGRVMSFFR